MSFQPARLYDIVGVTERQKVSLGRRDPSISCAAGTIAFDASTRRIMSERSTQFCATKPLSSVELLSATTTSQGSWHSCSPGPKLLLKPRHPIAHWDDDADHNCILDSGFPNFLRATPFDAPTMAWSLSRWKSFRPRRSALPLASANCGGQSANRRLRPTPASLDASCRDHDVREHSAL